VTVCLPLAGNVPNLLSTFGFDISDYTFQHSTVFRIETENTAPDARFRASLAASLPGNYDFTGRTLPTTSPPTSPTVVIRGTTGGGNVIVAFDGSIATDNEEPNSDLTFAWTTTSTGPAASPSSGSGLSFGPVVLAVPSDPDTDSMTTQPDNVFTYQIRLRVTDSCAASDLTTLTIQVRTADSDPAP
jgi:hypothetical protein